MNTQEIIEETTYDDPFGTSCLPCSPPSTLADNPFVSLASPFNTVNLALAPLSSLVKTTVGYTGTAMTTARVIDYKPDKIEDFVVAYCPSCEEPFVFPCLLSLALLNRI